MTAETYTEYRVERRWPNVPKDRNWKPFGTYRTLEDAERLLEVESRRPDPSVEYRMRQRTVTATPWRIVKRADVLS